jgi:holo-[acyl-carrier protein] synthase
MHSQAQPIEHHEHRLERDIPLRYAQGMIVAIGVDIIELDRIRGVWAREGDKFLHRIFTAPERAYCLEKADPLPHLAARFAAKEAFQKCWPQPFSWQDVWVERDGDDWGRRPQLRFVPHIQAVMLEHEWRAHLSLSHTHAHAVATAVLEDIR